MLYGNSLLYSVLAFVWYVLYVIGLWKMFEKAGEAGWKSIIPVYNIYIEYRICWQTNMFWTFAGLSILSGLLYGLGVTYAIMTLLYLSYALTLINAVIRAVFYYNLSLAYGHGLGYFLGLYLFNSIFVILIGFGSSRYVGNRYHHSGGHMYAL